MTKDRKKVTYLYVTSSLAALATILSVEVSVSSAWCPTVLPLSLSSKSPLLPSSGSSSFYKRRRRRRRPPLFLYQNNDPEDINSNSTTTRLYYQNDVAPPTTIEIEAETEAEFTRSIEKSNSNIDDTNKQSIDSATQQDQETEEDDLVVSGGLGDIMSGSSTSSRTRRNRGKKSNDDEDDVKDNSLSLLSDGLVTSESVSLSKAFGIHSPLDRMAVTANGNLQRLFSSYYDTPVRVHVEKCERRQQLQPREEDEQQQQQQLLNHSPIELLDGTEDAVAVWDRTVLLTIFDHHDEETTSHSRTVLCTADSAIYVHDAQVEALVESGKVGIGQLFRHFNILPDFHLVEAGRCSTSSSSINNIHHPNTECKINDTAGPDDTGFWRRYLLKSDLVTCDIHEVFCPNIWELSKQPPDDSESSIMI